MNDPSLIERNLNYTYELFASASGGTFYNENVVTWVHTLNSYWPNYVLRADLTNTNHQERLDLVRRQMVEELIPRTWVVGPSSRPNDLGDLLLANGFTRDPQYPEWSGMTCTLDQYLPKHQHTARLTIEVVQTERALREWIAMIGPMDPSWLAKLLFEPSLRFYLGRIDGQVVASALASFTNESVGLYMIGVLPSHRHQGIGKTMTMVPMIDGKLQGCRYAVLQATPMGERIYRQLGFEERCRYQIYRLKDSQ